jgi:hyperosmotically inducible periplasmic protein
VFKQKQNSMPAAAAAAAVAGASNHLARASQAPSSQELTEARQKSQIWTAFALNPHLRANEIDIAVREGRATLSGKVVDSVSRDLAFQIAQGVNGVMMVDDRLEVDASHIPPSQSAQRAFGNLVDDVTITCRVRSKVLWSRHADGIRATVETARGKVKLSGSADSGEAREFAGKLAANTEGVRAVANKLVVQTANAGVTQADTDVADSWITSKVKSTFRLSADLAGSDIVISTHSGVVSLTGHLASSAECAVAVELAGNVRGVKAVDSSSLTM